MCPPFSAGLASRPREQQRAGRGGDHEGSARGHQQNQINGLNTSTNCNATVVFFLKISPRSAYEAVVGMKLPAVALQVDAVQCPRNNWLAALCVNQKRAQHHPCQAFATGEQAIIDSAVVLCTCGNAHPHVKRLHKRLLKTGPLSQAAPQSQTAPLQAAPQPRVMPSQESAAAAAAAA